MNILLLSHHFSPFVGGIEVISELLADAFVQAGHKVRVVTWSEDTSSQTFPFSIIRNPSSLQLLRAHAWADLIFENNPCIRLAWPTLFFRRPMVTVLHTWLLRTNGAIGFQDRIKTNWWLNRATRVVAVSQALRQRSWAAATVIGNPYRAQQFRIKPSIAKRYDFVFLGRLVSDKGVALAIKALEHFSTSSERNLFLGHKPTLTIVGEGPERPSLMQLAKECGVAEQVDFAGSLKGESLVDCLNSHRFLLVPSIWEEPFGVVVLEALACGCIPIVSDGGGLPEAVGEAGLLFKRGDLRAMIACIEKLLTDPLLEAQLLAAAPVHLAAFQPAVVTRSYLDVIEAAVSA